MNKILKLFINENIKTWKKLSTKMMIIVAILSVIAALGLAKLMKKFDENSVVRTDEINWKESIKKDIDYIEEQLKKENLDDESKDGLKTQLEQYKLSIEYDISPWKSYWKTDAIRKMANLKVQKNNSYLDETEINKIESQISELGDKLKKDDYYGYMDFQINELKGSLSKKEIEQEEYKNRLEILELTRKYEIGKNNDEGRWKSKLLREIQLAQESIKTNIDVDTNKVLTLEKKNEYENLIKMNQYRLENEIIPISENNSYRSKYEVFAPMFSIFIISIISIVIAGGTISNEVSTGTIKFWALTPNKRWKILTAKILSVLFYIIVITLVISILTIIVGNLFFEEESYKYLYIKNGEVKVIGNTLFTIAQYFVKMIPVTLFVLFAIMLSTLTRNSAVSISFSLALYLGNGIAMTIINAYLKSEWIKFIPFNNLNIFEKIFTNYASPLSITTSNAFSSITSLTFSLSVLAVCAILMIVTMYDSFNKRDII